jgi:hypothetical protein
VDHHFFVRVRTKYRTFSCTTSQQKHPSTPLNTSESSDNGHKSHPPPSMTPPLTSVALDAANFALRLVKQPLRQHEDGAMAGSIWSSAEDVLGRGEQ